MAHEYFKKPIPNLDKIRERKIGYRNTPICPQNEEIIDLLEFGISGENYYFKMSEKEKLDIDGVTKCLFVRKSIAEKLLDINKRLEILGFELFVIDAFRSIRVQNFLHDRWAPKSLAKKHSDWNKEKINGEISKYYAYGGVKDDASVDPQSPPPHSTGGAIDLRLRKIKTKKILDMGDEFDEMTEGVFTDYLESIGDKSLEADRKNRRLLYWLMLDSGFVNNPTEWWHYSYGDQMWAKLSDQKHAIYSNIIL